MALQLTMGTAWWMALVANQARATYELGATELYLALVATVWGAPTILLGPWVGRLADLYSPAVVGAVSTAVGIGGAVGLAVADSAPWLLVAALTSGVARAVTQVAIDALPSRVLGSNQEVRSSILLGFASSVPIVAGPSLAAVMLANWGSNSAQWANAAVHLIGFAVFCVLRVDVPSRGRDRGTGAGSRRRSLFRDPSLREALVLTGVVWVSLGWIGPLEILFVNEVLSEPAETYAALQVAFGVALLAATYVMSKGKALAVRRWFFVMTVVLVGVGESLFASSRSVGMAFVAISLWGMAAGLFNPASRIAFLKAAPVEMHGRAMGLWRAVQSFGSLAPPILAGVVAHACGLRTAMLGMGVCTLLATAVVLGISARRGTPGVRSAPRAAGDARADAESGGPTSLGAADNQIHIEPNRRRSMLSHFGTTNSRTER
ncbi:MFS transporter [Streptomyces sp. NBC_00654]|uniref:MFS transporter n=1 Tax=Streptomyces sp. NBC_00654 TaxID=2975799 RepID=UPI00224DDAF6|nr:MFS transporter [Streptomyces sp. NBC_00654]MCX4967275.1 MFS transporter [Streptomyces sp. NBC_00654]